MRAKARGVDHLFPIRLRVLHKNSIVLVTISRRACWSTANPVCYLQEGWPFGGSPVQCWVRTASGHPSTSLVQNLNIEVITTLENDRLQYPPTIYLEVSEKRAILVKFRQWGLV